MSTDVINTEQPIKGTRRRKLRDWVLRITKILAIGAPLMFIMAGLGSKIGLWNWEFGLRTLTFKVGPVLLVACGVFATLSMLLSIMAPKKGFFVGAFAMIIPLVGMGQLAGMKNLVSSLPLIHDITTDTQNVPIFTQAIMSERAKTENVNSLDYAGKMAPTKEKDANGKPVMKLVSALQTQAYPKVRPLILTAAPDVAFGQAKAVASAMGWQIKSEDVSAGVLEATDSSFWYGFKDDVVIRIRASEGGGSIVDIRSVSRVGMSDIGANAKRIRIFLSKMAK